MIKEEYIIKYLRHELSEQEAAEMIEWLEKDKANQEFLFSLKEAYLLSNYEEDAREADSDEEWEKFSQQIASKQKPMQARRFSWKSIASYAALVIFCLSIGWTGNKAYEAKVSQGQLQSIETGVGQQARVTLPDGSSVNLNACSQLSYNPSLWEKQRTVQLSGEAIFDVTANKDKPFVVSTHSYDIRVLGTNFNVSAYTEEDKVITTLKQGVVEIHLPLEKKCIAKLYKGESLIFDKLSNEYTIKKLPVIIAYAWSNKEIAFEGNTLDEKRGELARHFGYTFRIAPEVKELSFKATLREESLNEFLQILTHITSDIGYRVQEQHKTVDIYRQK